MFDDVYSYLCNNYRSEYVYKNAIANKILLGRHSINTSTLLNEFRVGNSKADIVIINGDSSVYEVKSEYDSMERLQNQIKSYRTVFDYINIVTHFSQLDKIIKTVDKDIGIIVLTDQYLSYLSPKSSKSYLSQVIFNLSRTEIDTKLW
ncbi:MAG: sce7726 family protein [Proteobacteria bacterium]|nr:sce7726 family protein [Pseudomonadota bacterium]